MQFWAAFVSDIVLGEEASNNFGQRPYPIWFFSSHFWGCAVLHEAKLDCALIDISVTDSCVPRVAAGARPSWKLVQIVFEKFSDRIPFFNACLVGIIAVLYQAMSDCALIDISVTASCVPRAAAGARFSWKLVLIAFISMPSAFARGIVTHHIHDVLLSG